MNEALTLKLPEKIENADGTACAQLLALRGQKFDQNRPLCTCPKINFRLNVDKPEACFTVVKTKGIIG